MNPAERKLIHIQGLIESYLAQGEDFIPNEKIQTILDMEPEPFDEEEV